MNCRFRHYTDDEQKIRHTLDGECWLSYSHEGEPFSGKTPSYIRDQLLTGEYIVKHKNDGTPYLENKGPGARDKVISGEYKLDGGRRKSRKHKNKKRKTRRRN